MLRCEDVNRHEILSITITYNGTYYLLASKHLIHSICSELRSDEKNQDQFGLHCYCQVQFLLSGPFSYVRDVRGKCTMMKSRNSPQWQI